MDSSNSINKNEESAQYLDYCYSYTCSKTVALTRYDLFYLHTMSFFLKFPVLFLVAFLLLLFQKLCTP